MNYPGIGLQVPQILLPEKGKDMHHWAVIACDQYSSDEDYWQRLAVETAGVPSTLRLVFPEVYLEAPDGASRIREINQTMEHYLASGVLIEQPAGFILVDRKTSEVESRKGLMVALDLEQYDYNKGATSLIRATEGTILDRLPPRIKVRENAPIELPHIMVLIDDPNRTVIEPLFNTHPEPLYDFELIANGGHIKGYRIDQPAQIEQVVEALTHLADPQSYRSRYQVESEVMLYAMGDGNHSFATAKAIWENLKAQATDQQEIMTHPARYALVELVNLHDPGLEFEAIHRVLFNINPAHLLQEMELWFNGHGEQFTYTPCQTLAAAQALAEAAHEGQGFCCILAGRFGYCHLKAPQLSLDVASLQTFLDDYLTNQPPTRIDYIHGEEAVSCLGKHANNAGFYLPAISKDNFFRTIIIDGALPRKTFSMGEADEKRFYLECRRIR
ncbi:DUF1015 domain-containing protein [Geopsychrobacter electrodiphilus]|uniref:DUF1015 domain-containing protein n=1 Tax=Geopsychrobacter electrodiphilus TaxID=225196 RepID=UPI00035FEDA3|nr:DUF1015 domain-containing protein [Geopsychrobacter electrodiphilus]